MRDKRQKTFGLKPLEQRLMLDASLGSLLSSVVLSETDANTAEQSIDNDVDVTGSTTDFETETLTISTNGGAEDQLAINNEGTNAGEIGVSGTDITYGGTIIGSITSDGSNGNDLSITLNANADKASIERLIENLTYQNTSDDPTLNRTLTISLGAYFSENVSVVVAPENDAPVIDQNNGITVTEGGNVTITNTQLRINDGDNTTSELVFTVQSSPSNGQLELSTNAGVAITTFTQSDIDSGLLVYVHDASEASSDSFTFDVTDGTETLATTTFNITIDPVDDPLTLDTNTGADVSLGFSTSLGSDKVDFGEEVLRQDGNDRGDFPNMQSYIDNQNTQFRLTFTTGNSLVNAVPGQVLFESGGSGRGIGLYIDQNNHLAWYAGPAQNTPILLAPDALDLNTQYAVVIEIDSSSNQIRMHYREAGNHNWFYYGRDAEAQLNGFNHTDIDGGNGAGLGSVGSGSWGGYNGSVSGNTVFQGSIDSDLVLTRFPDTVASNTKLVSNDVDDTNNEIIYTITDEVDFGTITLNGTVLGLGDTFAQSDLNGGNVEYNSTIAPSTGDSTDTLGFSVSDGTTTINDTFVFNVNTVNNAPVLYEEVIVYQEDFEGGSTGWNNNTTTNDSLFSEFLGRFNRNINVGGNQELFQTFTLSGDQDYVTIEFDLYEIDSWDNEWFYIFINDQQIRSDRLRHNVFEDNGYALDSGTNITSDVHTLTNDDGYIGFRDTTRDQIHRYTLTIPTNGNDIKFGIGTSLNSNNFNDESFGIDNVIIKELRSTGGGNDRTIDISENIQNNDLVATMFANESDVGQTLTYSITGGTGAGLFSIDSGNGEIRVIDTSLLDFESGNTTFTLDIHVQDNGPGLLSDTQTLTINLIDALENTAPVISNQSFSISEGASNGDSVGTVAFTDTEGDGIERWQIISGNDLGIFTINQTTGEITVVDASYLNHENDPRHDLRIRAWDDNALGLFRDRTLRVDVLNVDDAPTLDRETIGLSSGANAVYFADTGNFYTYVNSATNFANAQAAAQSTMLNGVAGHLLVIESAAEKNFVRGITTNHVWLGISDNAQEGIWLYTDGPNQGRQLWEGRGANNGGEATNGFFADWRGNNEPNNGTSHNGAVFYNNDGRWVDVPLTNNYRYVIEWEGAEVANNDTYYVNHNNPDASDVNNGDSVGFVVGLDPEGDSLIYSIESGNDDGIFAIDPNTGEITIADNTNINATVLDQYTLTVRVTEANGANQFAEAPITIIFNENVALTQNAPLTATEGLTSTITTAHLNASDGESAASDIVFNIQDLPGNGQLELSTNPGQGILSFTLEDLQNGHVRYTHDGSENLTDSFTFALTDGGQTLPVETFNINVDPVNDAPILSTNTGTSINEGGNVIITSAMLNSTDIDDTATGLTYTASNYLRGHIEVDGVIQDTFTQDDIDNNRVRFVHNGDEGGTARFDISLADGGEDSSTPDTGTFNLTVNARNDSPIITTNNGFSVVEGGSTTITTAMLNVTDPDDSGAGLTYNLSNIVNGQIQLSNNLGIPVLSFTQSDLNAGRVVFIHDGGELNARFDVTVADGGEHGATTDTATILGTRIPVNDSPTISRNLLGSVDAGQFTILKTAVLNATDPDDSGTGLIYHVTNPVNGQVELLSNPNVAITSFTQADLENSQVVFRHDNSFTLSASFDIELADGGEDSATTDTATFTMEVNNTNDSPTITTNAPGNVVEGQHVVITSAILDSFDPDDFGADLTYTVSNPTNGHVAFTSDLSTAINSFTQADLDNGIVAFVHDGSETNTADFDVVLADGLEHGAVPDNATVSFTVTAFNDSPTLIVNDGNPNLIDFNDYTIDVFDPSQDGQFGHGTFAGVSPDGTTLELRDNAWKDIDIPYTLTADTVLTFEFRVEDVHEINGIGFDIDGVVSNGIFGYQLSGTQIWAGMDQSFRNYQVGDGWVRYDIPIGQDYTGAVDRLVFVQDNDTGEPGSSFFRNVGFYENNQVLTMNEGGSFNINNGHINSTDPDDSGTELTFTASNIRNGHIEVDGTQQTTFTQDDIDNNRVVFIHDGSDTLDAGFDISLSDGGEDSASAATGSFSIIVNAINDAPSIDATTPITVDEGATYTLTTTDLQLSDSDDIPRDVDINVTGTPSNGHLALSSNPNNAITTFTMDDLNQGRVIYVHDGSETISDAFTFNISDGSLSDGPATLNITVNPVNDAPSITTNNPLTLNEGGTQQLTTAQLNIGDPDSNVGDISISVSNTPDHGFLALAGDLTTPITSFTLTQLQNGDVYYIHDGTENHADSFVFSASDGSDPSANTTFNINITPVNDGPVITVGANIPVNEGENVTLTNAHFSVADPDNVPADLTITITSAPANGFIALSSAPSTSINSFTYAQLLNGDVIYVHDGSETVADNFSFTAGDGAITTAASTSNIDISPRNDSVQIVQNALGTVAEDNRITINNALLNTTDSDDAASDITYTITNISYGHIEVNNVQTTTFTQDDINNGRVEFVHDGSENATAHFDLSVADGLEHGASAATARFQMNVTPVNDAPHALWIDENIISERGAIGEEIGTLYAEDVDNVMGDMSFSIVNDIDDKFAIIGNTLVLRNSLNFTTSEFHDVTVRVTDSAGDFFEQTLQIEVEDVPDNVISPPSNRPIFEDTRPIIEEEKRRVSVGDAENSLLKGFLNKELDEQNRVFYQEGLSQITRNNTTLFIRDFITTNLNEQRGLLDEFDETNGNQDNTSGQLTLSDPDELMEIQNLLNIRQGPDMTEQLRLQDFLIDQSRGTEKQENDPQANNEKTDEDMPSIKSVEEQFDDIVMYNQERTNRLLKALQELDGS